MALPQVSLNLNSAAAVSSLIWDVRAYTRVSLKAELSDPETETWGTAVANLETSNDGLTWSSSPTNITGPGNTFDIDVSNKAFLRLKTTTPEGAALTGLFLCHADQQQSAGAEDSSTVTNRDFARASPAAIEMDLATYDRSPIYDLDGWTNLSLAVQLASGAWTDGVVELLISPSPGAPFAAPAGGAVEFSGEDLVGDIDVWGEHAAQLRVKAVQAAAGRATCQLTLSREQMPYHDWDPTNSKGQMLVHNGVRAVALAAGADGAALVADSAQPSGVAWGARASLSMLGFAGGGLVVAVGQTIYTLTGIGWTTTEAEAEILVRFSGPGPRTVRRLGAYVSANGTGAAGNTVTVRKNGGDTALTVSYGSGETGRKEDASNSFTVADGDRLSFKVVNAGTGPFGDLVLAGIWCWLE